jgi:hypothetical protein
LNFKELFLISRLRMLVSPFLLDDSLESLCPLPKDRDDGFFANSLDSGNDCTFQIHPSCGSKVGQPRFHISKEEQVAWSKVWALGRVRQLLGFGCLKTVL